jgi:hypothetical protein
MVIRVKVIPSWVRASEYIPKYWKKLSPAQDFKWENIEIVWDDPADYYVLLNGPNPFDSFDPKQTIIMQMEGGISTNAYWNWGEYSKPDPTKFLRVLDCASFRANVEWWVSQGYDELSKTHPIKTRDQVLGTVMSHNFFSTGHQLRVNFLHFMEHHCPSDIELDFWGGGWECNLPALSSHFIDQGVLPYKYWFHAERCSEPGYFCGGKLITGIVSECLVFYWGCPDITRWIDANAFIYIDLEHPEQAMRTIVDAIQSNQWEKRIDCIRAMKHKILNELSILPTIHSVINECIQLTNV